MAQRIGQIATDAGALQTRLEANQAFGSADLETFVLALLEPRAGEAILEIGCGTGKFLLPFARVIGAGGRVVGIDLSAEALAKAQAATSGQQAAVQLVHGSMDELATLVAPESFDAACSIYSLYYAANPESVVEQLAASLKPGGRLLVVAPRPGNNGEWFELLARAGLDATPPVDPNFVEARVAPACRRLFAEVTQAPFDNPIGFPSVQAVMDYWKSTPHYAAEAEGRMRQLVQEHFGGHDQFANHKRAVGLLASGRQ